MPTFLLQSGPNVDPNIRKVRNADPMPPLRTFLVTLTSEALATERKILTKKENMLR